MSGPDAPVTREQIERAIDAMTYPATSRAAQTLVRLAERVLAALDSGIDRAAVLAAYREADQCDLVEFSSGYRAGVGATLARIVADEKGGSGG